MNALIVGEKVIVSEQKTVSQLNQKGFGEIIEGKLVLDLNETFYLLQKKNLKVLDRDEDNISEEEFLKKFSKKKLFYEKFLVYKDLRDRGFIVKTGYKFGFDFRVYPRGKKPGEAHSQWVLSVSKQNSNFAFPEIARMVRMSHTLKTSLLLSVVDNDCKTSFYEVKRITP
ncbi:MAG: tRNA-intron lyase [archaeon]